MADLDELLKARGIENFAEYVADLDLLQVSRDIYAGSFSWTTSSPTLMSAWLELAGKLGAVGFPPHINPHLLINRYSAVVEELRELWSGVAAENMTNALSQHVTWLREVGSDAHRMSGSVAALSSAYGRLRSGVPGPRQIEGNRAMVQLYRDRDPTGVVSASAIGSLEGEYQRWRTNMMQAMLDYHREAAQLAAGLPCFTDSPPWLERRGRTVKSARNRPPSPRGDDPVSAEVGPGEEVDPVEEVAAFAQPSAPPQNRRCVIS